ncbi:MAG: nucleoside-diphosphate sugar epimerase/dehydratase [Gemmatimonadota bacterium]|nr:nucleoside-diphosphate sugar epimerase/dehydratase [Gemmatimonadota bacterium]
MRNRYFLLLDLAALCLSIVAAYTIRFEGVSWWVAGEGWVVTLFLLITIPARIVIFWSLAMYGRIWSLASVAELERILVAVAAAGVCSFVVGAVALPGAGLIASRVPLSVLALDALLSGGAVTLSRITARLLRRRRERRALDRRRSGSVPVLIVGAGQAGQMVARELLSQDRAGFVPVAFLDDDSRKHGLQIGDLPVLGAATAMPRVALATGVRHVIIAMPSASGSAIRSVLQLARASGLETRTVPSLHEQITRGTAVAALRQVRIEDLLQREVVAGDTAPVRRLIRGQTVLVTGAGGSIGSELCRQLAVFQPAQLVLLGRGENSIFEIQQELRARFPSMVTTPVILDVRDRAAMSAVMQRYAPAVVFHAAAHKHVPLMEANVLEAFRNNVVGTQSVVDAAMACGVMRLVLISTDKAVRPTSVMGATKRIAEQTVQLAAQDSGRAYVAVRFGNVLGSRGSVVPTFMRQILAGGPVLVTHPEMRRYFMTIPESVELVLQACAMGTGGEVYCLDMGEAVPIVNLARDLIQLSGLEPGVDIEVRFTGARPGEKLYEEMFFSAEMAEPTAHSKVLRSKHVGVPEIARVRLQSLLDALDHAPDDAWLLEAMHGLVEDFGADPAPDIPTAQIFGAGASVQPVAVSG